METIADRQRRLKRVLEEKRQEAAAERERELRWKAQTSARVVHPLYGELVVPNRSNFAAILCAAEVWGVDWSEVLNAEVRRIE